MRWRDKRNEPFVTRMQRIDLQNLGCRRLWDKFLVDNGRGQMR